jgi:hypothetical protein
LSGKTVTRTVNLRHGSKQSFDLRGEFSSGERVARAAPNQLSGRGAPGSKPNILFIMGDDIGWMQPACYHRGLMVGETPNIDRIANEGAIFMDYVAMQSCTSGRNAFVTGMYPLRTGMIPPQLPGSPSYLRPGTPCIAKFLLDLGYTTGQFGKNHLGDHPDALPTAHGFQEFWGYLYHLDAMQQVTPNSSSCGFSVACRFARPLRPFTCLRGRPIGCGCTPAPGSISKSKETLPARSRARTVWWPLWRPSHHNA